MSKAATKNAVIKPATLEGEVNAVELPKIIKLRRSQRVSLNALGRDAQDFNAQMKQLLVALQATEEAKREVFAEIASDYKIEVKELDAYQDNGTDLFLPKK